VNQDIPSERQVALLNFLAEYQEQYGMSATIREIGEHLAMRSPANVDHHLKWLMKYGYIIREPRQARTLRLTPKALQLLGKYAKAAIPLRGSIAAGLPLMAGEIDDILEVVDASCFPPQTYALRVKGDSMIDDHILDGDKVLIAPNHPPSQGDTIVATHITEGDQVGVTLKHYYRDADQVRLVPANVHYAEQIIPADVWDREWMIQGVMVGLVRLFG
jgi:repressor LexA